MENKYACGMATRGYKKCFNCKSLIRELGNCKNYAYPDGKRHLTCTTCIAQFEAQTHKDEVEKVLNLFERIDAELAITCKDLTVDQFMREALSDEQYQKYLKKQLG